MAGKKATLTLAAKTHLLKTLNIPKQHGKEIIQKASSAVSTKTTPSRKSTMKTPTKTPLKSVLRKFDTPKTERRNRVTIDATPSYSRSVILFILSLFYSC